MVVIAVVAFRTPTTRVDAVERTAFSQLATITHTATNKPSSLDSLGAPAPVPPGEDVPVAMTALAGTLDITARYTLSGEAVQGFEGTVRASLEVAGRGGWARTLDIAPPLYVSAVTATLPIRIDLADLNRTLATIEEETGFRPAYYDLTVAIAVAGRATVAGVHHDIAFSAPFQFERTRNQIRLVTPPSVSRDTPTEAQVSSTRQVGMAGVQLATGEVRWAAPILAAALAVAGGVSIVLLLRPATIPLGARLRYGSLIVPASLGTRNVPPVQASVQKLDDLARIARSAGSPVCYDARTDRYFVIDASALYELPGLPPALRPHGTGAGFAETERRAAREASSAGTHSLPAA